MLRHEHVCQVGGARVGLRHSRGLLSCWPRQRRRSVMGSACPCTVCARSDRGLAAISAIDRRPRLIISRYVMREVTAPCVAVVAVVSIVFLAYTLSLFLASAGDGVLSAGQVVTLSLLKTEIGRASCRGSVCQYG